MVNAHLLTIKTVSYEVAAVLEIAAMLSTLHFFSDLMDQFQAGLVRFVPYALTRWPVN